MRIAWVALLVACNYTDTAIPCGALICPAGETCSPNQTLCVTSAQIEACQGDSDGISCSYPGTSDGVCRDQTCVPTGCGNGVVDPGEVCDDGNTAYFDGCRGDCQGRFAKMQTPTAEDLKAVAVIAADNAYAVGVSGTLIHWDGVSWTMIPTGTTGTLESIWALSATDIYIGGVSGGLFHFDGATLTAIASGLTSDAFAIWASDDDNVYVFGREGADSIRYYNGSVWTSIVACSFEINNSMWGTGPTNVLLAGDGGICQYDGRTWTVIDPTNSLQVTGTAMTDVYSFADGTQPSIGHWDGASAWTYDPIPGTVTRFSLIGSTELLAVGADGVILQRDATGWTNVISPTELTLSDVAGTDHDNVFIVGDAGTVLH